MKRIALGLLLAVVSGPAWGQSCASLPYTLTNGTVANADQVMADLNCLALKGGAIFTGNVGIGTAAPEYALDVRSSAVDQMRVQSTGSNRAELIIDNQAGGQQSAIMFNNAGAPKWQIGKQADNSFFMYDVASVRDFLQVKSGNLLLQPAAGNVGIGTAAPSKLLYVNGSAGGSQGWNQASDGRLKTNIMPVTGGLALIERLNPVRYEWRKPADRAVGKDLKLPVGERQIGFIAQEVEKVVPEAVTTPAKGSAETYGLKQDNLIPVLVAAIKELQEQIKALQDQVAALKAQQ